MEEKLHTENFCGRGTRNDTFDAVFDVFVYFEFETLKRQVVNMKHSI